MPLQYKLPDQTGAYQHKPQTGQPQISLPKQISTGGSEGIPKALPQVSSVPLANLNFPVVIAQPIPNVVQAQISQLAGSIPHPSPPAVPPPSLARELFPEASGPAGTYTLLHLLRGDITRGPGGKVFVWEYLSSVMRYQGGQVFGMRRGLRGYDQQGQPVGDSTERRGQPEDGEKGGGGDRGVG